MAVNVLVAGRPSKPVPPGSLPNFGPPLVVPTKAPPPPPGPEPVAQAPVPEAGERGTGKNSRVGLRLLALVGAVVALVAAVLVGFMVFAGEGPSASKPARQAEATSAPPGDAPSGPADAAPTPSAPRLALPAVPATGALPVLGGRPSPVSGTVADRRTGLAYPRLGGPWKAGASAPFAFAQRAGKVAVPHAVIASAMLPGEAPEAKPKKESGYRDHAVRAARWSLQTQFPAGATLTWTGSQPMREGTGWVLGYEVAYGDRMSQALVAVVEVGKDKPAMLLATIPDTRRSHWADLNTLLTRIRPLNP
ncbi:hypothetical protein [Nonomuraea longicatena]|uniref:hypothetical protein n=1 Tax=Nonomuraea longicatena TaxID=83682 RepID=UPI0031E10643